jgi:hypothetical protein
MKTQSKKQSQITHAKILGAVAFSNGIRCASALDADFCDWLNGLGRRFGEKYPGEASSLEIMSAWQAGWTQANLAAEVSP